MSIADIGLQKNKKSLLYCVCCCLIWCLFFYIVFQKGCTIFNCDTPKEIREMNTVVFADHFASGDNLYAVSKLDNSIPVATSMYGFLVPLILAPFIWLFSFTSLNALQICELITLLVEIAGAFFFYRLLWRKTSHNLLSAIGMIFFYYCYWRYHGFGGAFPDQWGVSLSVILMYIIYEDSVREICRPGKYAAIVIALFYVKPYFVFTVIGLCVYILLYSRAAFKKLVLYGISEGILSVFVVYWLFPLYFSEALPIGQGQTTTSNWPYSLNQVKELSKAYEAVMFFCVLNLLFFIYKRVKNKQLKVGFSYELCQSICIFPFTIYIAQNEGTIYTYFLQLWYPYVTVCGIVSAVAILDRIKFLKSQNMKIVCYALCPAMVLISFDQMLRVMPFFECHMMTEEEKAAWENSYRILDEYVAKGEILVPMLLSGYCIENDMETADYGQAHYNSSKNLQNYEESKLWTNLFLVKYTGALLEKNIHYENVQIKDAIKNQLYSCIALSSVGDYRLSGDEILDAGYRVLEKETLYSGNQKWNVVFYVRD